MTLALQLVEVPEGEAPVQRDYYFTQDLVRIGRHFEADLCLPASGGTISRNHASILQTGRARYRVTDTSTNGTALNGAALEPGATALLADGDVLEVGGFRILVGIVGGDAQTARDAPEEAALAFEPECDLAGTGPLIDAPAELDPEPEARPFALADEEEGPLLFDPFAEPEIMRPAAPDVPARPPAELAPAPKPRFDRAERMRPPVRYDCAYEAAVPVPPDHMRQALERTVERFMGELDPSALETEYSDYVGGWWRRSRYWSIHKKHFAKRARTGELRRTFMAYFLEEMRK